MSATPDSRHGPRLWASMKLWHCEYKICECEVYAQFMQLWRQDVRVWIADPGPPGLEALRTRYPRCPFSWQWFLHEQYQPWIDKLKKKLGGKHIIKCIEKSSTTMIGKTDYFWNFWNPRCNPFIFLCNVLSFIIHIPMMIIKFSILFCWQRIILFPSW